MYCSGCGQPLPTGQQFCPNCGRAIIQPVSTRPIAATPVFYTRVHRHLQALSILWIAYGVWTILGWVLAMTFFAHMFGGHVHHWDYGPWGHGMWSYGFFAQMPWFMPFITIILIGRAILSFATGFALLAHASWARVLAIVVAFLTILKPITGTALAIYTLWVLLPRNSGREYEQIASSRIGGSAVI